MTPTTIAAGDPLVLVNPRASGMADHARRDRIVAATVAAVRSRTGREPVIEAGSLATMRASLAAAGDAPLVVAIGGDGSVREAAATMANGAAPLAIVPAGTGNVLAGSLGIRGIGPALDAIRSGSPRRLDLGRARWGPAPATPGVDDSVAERIFIVACGMGLDARIMAAAENEWKRRLRFGAYVGAAIRELGRLAPSRFRIVADGDAMEIDGYLAMVANAGQLVPGRIGPRQPIDPSSGTLELIVLGGTDPLAALQGAARLLLGTGELQGGVIRRSIRRVTIAAEPEQPIETDGDHHRAGSLEVEVVPGAVSVLVPR
ncbi:MAG TPA: diacylglycerol kinase family protein [Candidatus Limnocylindrales bacterium]|nr:diacylglycerol kinase family protein [Candidatus Limnocylindrales bacterium]